jgi:hypothetical protein
MDDLVKQYVHVLLFSCPRCGDPIPSAVVNGERNIENVDGRGTLCGCKCGWSGSLLGLHARQHWVAPWDVKQPKHETSDNESETGLTFS